MGLIWALREVGRWSAGHRFWPLPSAQPMSLTLRFYPSVCIPTGPRWLGKTQQLQTPVLGVGSHSHGGGLCYLIIFLFMLSVPLSLGCYYTGLSEFQAHQVHTCLGPLNWLFLLHPFPDHHEANSFSSLRSQLECHLLGRLLWPPHIY